MTDTSQILANTLTASPVDFATYGHYGVPASAFIKANGQTKVHYPIQGRLSDDGSSDWPAEPGRYHLYVSFTCPWAQRPLIALKLRGLEGIIDWSAVDPVRDGRGWAFRAGPGHGPDPVNGFALLREAYLATDPAFDGHISVPALWDKVSRRLVSNHFPTLTADLETAFASLARTGVDLYPASQRAPIDEFNERTTAHLLRHNPDPALTSATLAWYDERLRDQRFLLGSQVSDADLLLYAALVRMDFTVASVAPAQRPCLSDYPHLWDYARDLYEEPAFRTTTNFDHLDLHNRAQPGQQASWPSPASLRSQWAAPHHRDRLS
ncbi:MAG TPA: glutathione S-transferase C-terminal domain-containing protein [Acidimicrobiales bacterium]|nr:glutathione S-transferase C-terminal domain-containing protein [Acidimicrobiales bacterium]